MARPPLGNSNVKRLKAIGLTEKITASAWLNIEDPELENLVVDYYRNSGNKPSVQLQVANNGSYETVTTISLFVNDPPQEQIEENKNDEPMPF